MLLKLIQCTRVLDQAGDHSSYGEGDGIPPQLLVKKAEFNLLHPKLAKEQNSIVLPHQVHSHHRYATFFHQLRDKKIIIMNRFYLLSDSYYFLLV